MKFRFEGKIFTTVKYKGAWTVKYGKGNILALAPYTSEKKLIAFLKRAGAKRVK